MKLTKQNVCVFIENEQQLEEARKMLEKYGENISPYLFSLSIINKFNYLVYSNEYFRWYFNEKMNRIQITLQQLEEILKQSK